MTSKMADLQEILEGSPNSCYGKEEQPQDDFSHAKHVSGGDRTQSTVSEAICENAKDKIQHHVDKVTEIRKLLRFRANVKVDSCLW